MSAQSRPGRRVGRHVAARLAERTDVARSGARRQAAEQRNAQRRRDVARSGGTDWRVWGAEFRGGVQPVRRCTRFAGADDHRRHHDDVVDKPGHQHVPAHFRCVFDERGLRRLRSGDRGSGQQQRQVELLEWHELARFKHCHPPELLASCCSHERWLERPLLSGRCAGWNGRRRPPKSLLWSALHWSQVGWYSDLFQRGIG